MAETATITLTSSWVKVVDTAEDYVLQNITAGADVYVIYDDTAPADSALGHTAGALDGISSAIFGNGDVYVKGTPGAKILITK